MECFYRQKHIYVFNEHKYIKTLYSIKLIACFSVCTESVIHYGIVKLKLNRYLFNSQPLCICKFRGNTNNGTVCDCIGISAFTGIDIIFRHTCCFHLK